MGEQVEDQNVDMGNPELAFDNLTILKEFSNIANLVKNEDFLETVPKAKLRRVKWVPMFNCLKQGILDEMIQELSSMWQYENMHEKIKILEKQKEKFSEINTEEVLWRPQLADVKAQLKASDVSDLQTQKIFLESLAKQYESRVNRLKKNVTARRGYLKVLQLDIQKYQQKKEDLILKISEQVENHQNLTKLMSPMKLDTKEINWTDKDSEIEN